MVAAVLALAALLIDPTWHSDKRALELRVRRGPELWLAARSLADRLFSERDRELPAVASGKDRQSSGDELTDEDRRLLQRLVEEKLRE